MECGEPSKSHVPNFDHILHNTGLVRIRDSPVRATVQEKKPRNRRVPVTPVLAQSTGAFVKHSNETRREALNREYP